MSSNGSDEEKESVEDETYEQQMRKYMKKMNDAKQKKMMKYDVFKHRTRAELDYMKNAAFLDDDDFEEDQHHEDDVEEVKDDTKTDYSDSDSVVAVRVDEFSEWTEPLNKFDAYDELYYTIGSLYLMYLKGNRIFDSPKLVFWKLALCPYDKLLEDVKSRLEIDKDSYVLDAGTGLGVLTYYLVRDYNCLCTGVDINEYYCNLANKIMSYYNYNYNCKFYTGDLTRKDYYKYGLRNKYDYVFSCHAMDVTWNSKILKVYFENLITKLYNSDREHSYLIIENKFKTKKVKYNEEILCMHHDFVTCDQFIALIQSFEFDKVEKFNVTSEYYHNYANQVEEIKNVSNIFDELSEINRYLKYREFDFVKKYYEERLIQAECSNDCIKDKHYEVWRIYVRTSRKNYTKKKLGKNLYNNLYKPSIILNK